MSKDRGDFVLDPRGYPKRYIREGGFIREEMLRPTGRSRMDEEDQLDELMDGIDPNRLGGGLTGFGKQYRELAAASGTSADSRGQLKRHESYDNDNSFDTSLDSLEEDQDDEGDADLFGQPNPRPRREFGDFVEARAGQSADNVDLDDIWDTSTYDEFTDDENGASGPITEHPPHRQKKGSLDNLLDDLFDE